jgi:hypothetical protein
MNPKICQRCKPLTVPSSRPPGLDLPSYIFSSLADDIGGKMGTANQPADWDTDFP